MKTAAIALVLMATVGQARADRDPFGDLVASTMRTHASAHVERGAVELDKSIVDFCAQLALDPNGDASDGLEGDPVVAMSGASCAPAMKGMLPDVTPPAERMLPPLANGGISAGVALPRF